MSQKKKTNKKTNKKTHKKPRAKQVVKTRIVQQAIPNYASDQVSGHQYNNKENVPFVNQQQQQQSRTDNLVGDLVSKLISKIENDGTQQTQQYTKEVQPITNDNSNSNSGQTSGNTQTVNIYPNNGQAAASTDTPDPKKTVIETAAGTALSAATGYSAEATGGIAAGSAVGVGLIGGLIAGRKKLGQAIKNTFSGNKSGGTATSSRLLKGEGDYVRGTKPGATTDLQTGGKRAKAGKYDKVPDEPNPLQADFEMQTRDSTRTRSDKLRESTQEQLDRIREQARKSEQKRNATKQSLATQTTPKPSPRAISTQTTPKPSPRATPQATPQATPRPSQEATPLNLLLHPSPRYIEPTTSLSPGTAAGVTRARTSGIQEHTGVLTRNIRREVGEAHTELKSNIPKSKHKQYVSGYNSRRYDDKKGKTKPLVPVYNLEHKFNKGYFRKELENNKLRTQLSSRSNPFDGTDDSISERAATSRNRSTMLSQTLTPETHVRKRKPVTRNV